MLVNKTAPFHELKQNVTRDFLKKYFHGEKDEKSTSCSSCKSKFVADKNLFLHLRINLRRIIVLPLKWLRMHWGLLTISKTSKKAHEVMFFDM